MAGKITPIRRGRPQCDPCDEVFGQIRVYPTIKKGTRVEWTMHPRFTDPAPHTFQLQVGRTGNPGADDWVAVGAPAVNTYFMEDDENRSYGRTQWTHYRICLETNQGTYFSEPRNARGDIGFRDWRRVREMIRAHQIDLREEAGTDGYLLKRKLFGIKCEAGCIDWVTEEVTNPQCSECFGTGFVGGYYDPFECSYAALSELGHHTHLDEGKSRGTVDDDPRVAARILAIPQLVSRDVWVRKHSDERWEIRKLRHAAEYRGMPIVYQAEFRLLPFSHPVYEIEIEGQLPS